MQTAARAGDWELKLDLERGAGADGLVPQRLSRPDGGLAEAGMGRMCPYNQVGVAYGPDEIAM